MRFTLAIFVVAILGIAAGRNVNLKAGARAGSGPSNDPIATTAPNLPGGSIAVDAPPGPFFRDFKAPFPTDTWWSGFTVSNQDAVAAGPFPYHAVTKNTGLEFGVAEDRNFDGTSIHQNVRLEWGVSFQGLPNAIDNRKATSWDTMTVCLQYLGGASTMDSCLIPGSPYMTFTFSNAAVQLTSVQGNANVQWITQGKKARLTNNAGTYLLYVLDGSLTLTKTSDTVISSPAGFTGTIRLVKLAEAGQESILDNHSETYATGLDMTYSVSGDVGEQVWTWRTVGDASKLLILSWPHHRKALQAPVYTGIQYLTIKGYMKGVVGNRWVLRYDLPTISWFAANDPHPSCRAELEKTVEAEVAALTVMIPGDFYFWGGAFGRAAQIATISEHIGRNDLVQRVVDILKQSIQYWFDPTHRPAAAYEPGWGGFINGDGWNNTWVDFGNAYYNDHHFHYGYLLHGAAVIGKYDRAWLNEHIDFLTHVARDVGNPSPNDPHYAVTRHMDWFHGHSWASGIANGAGGRDQESSGEAINGYYGLLLFAHVTNNQALINYSRLLVAMEIAGAQMYWHLYPTANDPDTPYPEQGFRELVTVGNVMDTQVGAWLFWGAQRIQIAAIQILPLTPIGQFTFDNAWMEKVLSYCQVELDDPTYGDDFKSVIYAAYAKVNPQVAAQYSANLFDWGSGNSASNQLYFVSTQSSSSDICTSTSQQPEGIYRIQDVASGLFVTLSGSSLTASSGADVLAAKFELGFKPGGGTIKALSNGKFVTASPDGNAALSAARDTAASYEVFRWTAQADGTFQLTAMVNKKVVSTAAGTGQLLNNGVASRYRLVPSDNSNPAPIPTQGLLKNSQSGRYVVATAGNPTLMATGGNGGEGTRWSFERIATSPDSAPQFAIKSQTTNKYVTGNMDGTEPLSALRDAPQAWEYFQIIPYQNGYIIVHDVSGLAVTTRADSALIDSNNSAIDGASIWVIE